MAIIFIACSETDEALEPTEESLSAPEHLSAPEQLNTAVLQLVSRKVFFDNQFSKEHSFVLPSDNTEMVTPIGKLTDVYIVVQGQLTKQERIFKREMYQFLWCFLDEQLVLVNILDHQIRPIYTEEDWDHMTAKKDEWDKLSDKLSKEGRSPEVIFKLVEAALSKKTFFFQETIDSPGDKIEVEIKHRFTYMYKSKGELRERDMLFVNIKRNITRPHIKFPRPLLF